MKKHFFSRVLVLMFALLLPFTAVSNASADPAYHFAVPISFEYTVQTPCGFDIYAQGGGILRGIAFFEDGSQIGLHQIFGQIDVTWSANGKTLAINMKGPMHYTFEENNFVMVALGPSDYVVIPGYGPVFGLAGRMLFRVIDGQWTMVNATGSNQLDPDWGAICDYFSE